MQKFRSQVVQRWRRSHRWGRQLWQRLSWPWRIGLIGLALVLLVRSLPYLAPIRAAALAQDQQAVEFVDRNGFPLGTLLTRDQDHTIAVPLDQIAPVFRQAIIAAEDQRFYHHGALDERAIARALLEASQARQIVSGASTITMQLARMIDPVPFGLVGKAREIWTAWRLAAGSSKDDILQAYINRLPMGGNVYGVEAAARTYFGVPAQDLTLAQATLLAGIPNDPNNLSPYDHLLPLKRRQTYVLDRMVSDRYITRDQATRTYNEAVALHPRQQGIIAAPHFLFWLAAQLPPAHPPQITTTLDRPLQQFVETQIQQVVQSLAPQNVHHAAAIVVDNQTGAVLAYVGSPDYFATAQMGRNDGVQALRQPGSTLKPFVYELALEQGTIHPNTVLADVPTHYAIPGAKLYSPSDYSETFQGPVRVRVALANSLNIPAVRVLAQLGVPTFLQRLHHLGFHHLTESPDHYGLGLTLGSGEVNLWELAQAYLVIARQGSAIALQAAPPTLSFTTPTYQAQTPTPWQLITDMLSDAHARSRSFGVNSLLALPFPAAVKTGTSSDFRDTWTVGFTTDYTVAVWVGNFDSAPMQKVSGVMGAAPLWNRIMLHLHEQREPTAFATPQGMVKQPICSLSGGKPNPACPQIVEEYFAPADLVAHDQNPDPFYRPIQQPNGTQTWALQLPPEYNEWLAQQPPASPLKMQMAQAKTGSLRIVAPQNGDVFVIGPAPPANAPPDPRSSQKLQFHLAAIAPKPVQWRLNGKLLTTQTGPIFTWNPQPGQWTLQVSDGTTTDQVRFEIQTATNQPTRRGFSLKPTAQAP